MPGEKLVRVSRRDQACQECGYADYADLLQRLRNAASLSAVVSHFAGVRYVGRSPGGNLKALCPFHEDHSPSFSVHDERGFHCFAGSCGMSGGDAIDFLMRYRGCSLDDAVMELAGRVGLPCPDFSSLKGHGSAAVKVQAGSGKSRIEPIDIAAIEETGEERGDPAMWDFDLPPREAEPPGLKVSCWSRKQQKTFQRAFTNLYSYRDVEGRLLHLIGRNEWMEGQERKKSIIPLTWRRRPAGFAGEPEGVDALWVMAGLPRHMRRPVYRADVLGMACQDLQEGRIPDLSILYVEGEKTAEAAARLLEDRLHEGFGRIVALSPQGGIEGAARADWTTLRSTLEHAVMITGKPVELVIWPDADWDSEHGNPARFIDRATRKFADGILSGMREAGLDEEEMKALLRIRVVTPPRDVEKGWDLADAEEQGWSADRVLAELSGSESLGDPSGPKTSSRQGKPDSADASGTAGDPGGISDDFDPTAGMDPSEMIFPLGHKNGTYYFYSSRAEEIVSLTSNQIMQGSHLVRLQTMEWFSRHYPGKNGGPNWQAAGGHLVQLCQDKGIWDEDRLRGPGIWRDGNAIVVNSGLSCWVAEGPSNEGHFCRPIEVESSFVYATEQDIGMPDLEGFMTDDDPGLLAFRQMITDLPWREDVKDFNAMTFSGWLALAGICGVPAWRPHLWLDGSRGSGKSWIIENIIGPLLGDYCLHVKGNSTEAGLRDYLNNRATAVVFDEAEMENRASRTRMEGVMTILRHITSGQRARVVQGSPGGGIRRTFRPTAMFLLSSISVNLEHSADRSRFARVHLARPLDPHNFTKKIAIPAGRILTPAFSSRFIGRMVRRAFALRETAEIMITALRAGDFDMDARTADVHGTLLAGAYLLYHDNDLESVAEALDWIEGLGKIVWSSLCKVNEESRDGFDHDDILSTILSSPIVVESQNSKVTETGSSLLHCVMEDELADDCLVVPETAERKLQSIGIRFVPAGTEGVPDDRSFGDGALVIACRHPGLRTLLEKTPWVSSYQNVLLQIDGAREGSRLRFNGARYRTIMVPIRNIPHLRDGNG